MFPDLFITDVYHFDTWQTDEGRVGVELTDVTEEVTQGSILHHHFVLVPLLIVIVTSTNSFFKSIHVIKTDPTTRPELKHILPSTNADLKEKMQQKKQQKLLHDLQLKCSKIAAENGCFIPKYKFVTLAISKGIAIGY